MSSTRSPRSALGALGACAALLATGCGGSSSSGTAASQPAGAGATGALAPDARSAATGDIPDNQVFLTFTDVRGRWTMKYPEGWTQSGAAGAVTFSDKNNLVRVAVAPGAPPSPAGVVAQLRAAQRRSAALTVAPASTVTLPAGAAIRVRYSTQSAPNPVTGRRVTLLVDRYVLGHAGRVATIDLGTPHGVDNVDAYRLMVRSFRWR